MHPRSTHAGKWASPRHLTPGLFDAAAAAVAGAGSRIDLHDSDRTSAQTLARLV